MNLSVLRRTITFKVDFELLCADAQANRAIYTFQTVHCCRRTILPLFKHLYTNKSLLVLPKTVQNNKVV